MPDHGPLIHAAIFDVFGTCTDWRSAIAREATRAFPGIDGPGFADAWRAQYDPAMDRIRSGARGYTKLDQLHLENLWSTCGAFDVTPQDPVWLARAWERLDTWPDVVPGLTALKTTHMIAPCSNGSIGLMTRLAKHAGLPWDAIVGADIAQDYKPKPEVYLASCEALLCEPSFVLMVAAHNADLHAAQAAGLKTAFVARPTEHGQDQTIDLGPTGDWDFIATDFLDLARQLA